MPNLESSQRGAVALGALLAFVLLVTMLGALRIYQQLAGAAAVQHTLVRAQEQLYAVLRAQYDEENGVRGYVATRREYFLGNRVSANDEFDRTIAELETTTEHLGIPAVTTATFRISELVYSRIGHPSKHRWTPPAARAGPPRRVQARVYSAGPALG